MKVNFKFWIKLSFAIAVGILLSGFLKATLLGFFILLDILIGNVPSGLGV